MKLIKICNTLIIVATGVYLFLLYTLLEQACYIKGL